MVVDEAVFLFEDVQNFSMTKETRVIDRGL